MTPFAISVTFLLCVMVYLHLRLGFEHNALKKKMKVLLDSRQHLQEYPKMDGKRLFIGMDGILASFPSADQPKRMYEKGYFLQLKPNPNAIQTVKDLLARKDMDVFVLSGYFVDSDYSLQEKNEWLNESIPELDKVHRMFVPYGMDIKDYVPGGLHHDDYYLDDTCKNAVHWFPKENKLFLRDSGDSADKGGAHPSCNSPSAEIEGYILHVMGLRQVCCEANL